VIYILVFIYGLIFGSFFNVCIARIPKGESLVFPGSHCPKCKERILWYWNIPLLSFIFLKGQCKNCGRPIAWVYPLVELLSGILAVGLLVHFRSDQVWHWAFQFLIYYMFVSGLLILSLIDMEYFIIPDRFSIGGMVAGVIVSSLYPAIHGFETMTEGFIHSFVSCWICFFI